MLKQYQSINSKRLSTFVKVDETEKNIIFQNWIFQTDNEKLQQAIEKSPRYGKSFVCITQEEVMPQEEETVPRALTPIEDVTKKQFAIEWFQGQGVEVASKTTISELKVMAQEMGYEFVNL